MGETDRQTDTQTDIVISTVCVCVCVAVEVSSYNDTVQLLDDGQLRVDLHRGALSSHAAVCRRVLGKQRGALVHRPRLESVSSLLVL